jgi:hypothetical protein
MKRPAIEGDKWRLDKILERKAVGDLVFSFFVPFVVETAEM